MIAMSDTNTIIVIGREFGCGGKLIAEAIGRKLGIEVFDSELLAKAAQESGLSASLFERRDERRRLWTIGNAMGMNDGDVFRIQSEVIREIAAKGNAIFVGRAADYILRDMPCLSVFVKAPIEFRCRCVVERDGIDPQTVENYIVKRDRDRAQYYNFYTFGHWGKAANYDMCVDSSLLGIEGTAELIIEFGRKSGKIKL